MEQTTYGGELTLGVCDFFFLLKQEATVEMSEILKSETRARCFHFWPFLMVFVTVSEFTLIVRSPSSKISSKNSFCLSLNGDLEHTTFGCRRPRNN